MAFILFILAPEVGLNTSSDSRVHILPQHSFNLNTSTKITESLTTATLIKTQIFLQKIYHNKAQHERHGALRHQEIHNGRVRGASRSQERVTTHWKPKSAIEVGNTKRKGSVRKGWITSVQGSKKRRLLLRTMLSFSASDFLQPFYSLPQLDAHLSKG